MEDLSNKFNCKVKLIEVNKKWLLGNEYSILSPFFTCDGKVVGVAEDGSYDRIIPYFDTKFYINLDTMNILYLGAKGCSNFIMVNLPYWCECRGRFFNRTTLLCALEMFFFNQPFDYSDLFKVCSGSIIAMSLGGSVDMKGVLYDDILTVERIVSQLRPKPFEGEGVRPTMTRIHGMLSILRTEGLDYSVYACLGKPELHKKLIERLGLTFGTKERIMLYNYLKNDRCAIVEELGSARDFEFAKSYYQMADSFIDLERITNRIKGVLNRDGR